MNDVDKKVADYKLLSLQEDCFIHLSYCIIFFFNVQHWQIDLKVSGDASINPGPTYAADEALLGSFHQDHERFGYTSSILCDGNLLCAMC